MKHATWVIGILILVVIGGVVFLSNRKTEPEPTVRVGYLPGLVGYLHFVAADQGFYQKQGITVEATEFQSSNQLYDALAQGKVDITPELAALPVFINQVTDPGKVKIIDVAHLRSTEPFDQVVVLPTSPIQSLPDLARKKIGVFPGSTGAAFLKDFLSKRGIDVSGIEFVQLPAPNQIQALEAGSIDALYAYEPNRTYALVKQGARLIGPPIFTSYVDDDPNGVAVISSAFLTRYPALAKRAIGAYDQASEFSEKNDTQLRTLLSKDMKIDPEVAQKMSLIHQGTSTEIDQAKLQAYADVLLSIGELKARPDLSTLIYR